MPDRAPAPAIFIDRDGTVMRDVDYCGDPKDVEIFEGAAAALGELKARGYKIIIITNQSGIGRGYFDEAAYRLVEKEVERRLGGGLIDATYFCPHTPEQNCACRKPAPGMVLRAVQDLALDLSRSWFIGDKESDMQCGRRAGTKTVLVTGPQIGTALVGEAASFPSHSRDSRANQTAADAIVPDLPAAARSILLAGGTSSVSSH